MSTHVAIPKTPPNEVLYSMAMTYRHDFGLEKSGDSPLSSGTTQAEREHIIQLMRKLYEEVAGQR